MAPSLAQRIGGVIGQIQQGETLSREEAALHLGALLEHEGPEIDFLWSGLFAAIQSRGAGREEVEGFVDAALAYDPAFRADPTDKVSICPGRPVASITGSGKDSWKTYNISTTAAFAAVACGVRVLKPGSRAISSVTGAIDLLRYLDLPEIAQMDLAAELLETTGLSIFGFANCVPRYARRYDGRFLWFHPLSYVLPPLAIPFRLDALVYGIADPRTDFSLDLLLSRGMENCAVVATELHRGAITDELIPFGKSMVSVNVAGTRFCNQIYNACDGAPLGLEHRASHAENAKVLLDVLSAQEATPPVRAAAMAAASILVTAGHEEGLLAAYREALDAILTGAAYDVLVRYRLESKRLTTPVHASAAPLASPAKAPSAAVVTKACAAHRQIAQITDRYGYAPVAADTTLTGLAAGVLSARFSYQDGLAAFDEVDTPERAIVTGFGPTNSPTAGTMSVLLKTLALQRRLGCDAEIIISDLGAFLSRNASWDELRCTTETFLRFVRNVAGRGTGGARVVVRSHIDKGNLALGSFLNEHGLETQAFLDNKEATELLYDELGLLGTPLGIITDSTYTVADIIKPFFRKAILDSEISDKRRVLVVAGIEEHYFPRLAGIALGRLRRQFSGTHVPADAKVSALYTKLVPGFGPFPKMSKSIPGSGVFLDDSDDVIFDKIVGAPPQEHACVLEMIRQASEWDDDAIAEASSAHDQAASDPEPWRAARLRYAETFSSYAACWRAAKGQAAPAPAAVW